MFLKASCRGFYETVPLSKHYSFTQFTNALPTRYHKFMVMTVEFNTSASITIVEKKQKLAEENIYQVSEKRGPVFKIYCTKSTWQI